MTKPLYIDPELQAEALLAESADLRKQIGDLKADVAELQVDNEMMARTLESNDQLKALMAEIARYRALTDRAERTLAARTPEYNERARLVAYWKKRAQKTEKLLQKAA